MKHIKSTKGFTLVEIMIVVAIIALLAAIAVPNFLRARERSQATAVLNEARMVEGAINQWAIETSQARGAAPTPAIVASFLKPGPLQAIFAGGKATSPSVTNCSFVLATLGAAPQVKVGGTSNFDATVVPASFWDGFQ